jgi:hypothetical protein
VPSGLVLLMRKTLQIQDLPSQFFLLRHVKSPSVMPQGSSNNPKDVTIAV